MIKFIFASFVSLLFVIGGIKWAVVDGKYYEGVILTVLGIIMSEVVDIKWKHSEFLEKYRKDREKAKEESDEAE